MDKKVAQAILSLGTNLGDRKKNLENAILKIDAHPEIEILQKGTPLNTVALEVTDQPDFLNQLVRISTTLSPQKLLGELLNIENELGRIRVRDKGPRTIDIDILTYEKIRMHEKGLHLPHHSLFTRPFILELLDELGEASLAEAFGSPSEG
ncbi:2-amino-4-hydroxy-6-hydroxymethyldihydropteridine diphosphokinase [Leptospira wolffii]|uniref:2-amino-4-hydroxy-6-hydroxymethyldihydropteridine pyrophosphokinase n=1 Tax=Leptospira wolffii TaxID=409998 RepID=A0A2M9ZFD8_9LEPT|nr:2-amino-4-hydroxy-6-hydroxymethyldihydropteridine diphosphokinase [Leptospira wolffii]PJZ67150.1 2-amino-4-hydroxy-6-hydroxymethyldihydropteridine diphosphokinase [Leptospira wolffii]TGK62132.1 2-amino-4-hydroxy-6-hydroxymethyldihydropteridine diphosphokinase [Leptospira wolffii]TGK66503.1 2-amino-4-hydroxy-6-hydroxymethyldihydropteridine diphosphokinase [Leptospira wolffii]TGK74484.1 2-amino-4-hydroxy-6-hydroxymethyldihydropteridine diphosphokinase [Leptospira wolffii]TGL31941.1 2-amino-4-